MVEVSATGHSASDSRTFDCPWCGAISQVPAGHLGEHFDCPECHKSTKLTEANTSNLPPTAPPPDAPHLSGDRTFDCPWCGAISSIPSSHLGEHFHCPECRRHTKLTEKNTTRRPPTEPPPDAPHADAAAGATRGAIAALVLVLVGAGIWMLLAGGRDEPERVPTPGPAPVARTPGVPAPPSRPPAPGPDEAAPARVPASREPPAPAADAVGRAEARLADAKAQVSLAEARLAEVRRRLAPLSGPEAEAARQNLAAARELAAETRARRERLGPEPAVEAVRGFNLETLQSLGRTSARARVAEAALAKMREDPGAARDVAGLAWREVNFHGHGFQRAVEALEASWAEAGKPVPAALRDEEAAAAATLETAKAERAAAEAALAALRAR